MRVLLDANAVLRYLLGDEPAMAEKTKQAIGFGAFLLPEVLAEIVYVLSGVYAVPRAELAKKLDAFLDEVQCDQPAVLRRALWHMEHCGWFRTAKGFIIGRPLHYGEEMMGMDQYNAITEILKKYNVPIIMDADFGHLPPSMPLIIGAKADVYCEGNDLRVRFTRE